MPKWLPVTLVAIAAVIALSIALREPAGPGSFKAGTADVAVADACPVLGPGGSSDEGTVPLPFVSFDGVDGAHVEFRQEFTVAQNYFLGRYGQVTLAVGGRVFHPNNGTCVTPYDEAERFIVLDDGSNRQNPSPVPYLAGGTLRTGSTVADVSGRIDLADVHMNASGLPEWYVLTPDGSLKFDRTVNPRPPAPPEVGGNVRVAVFNVENYFTTRNSRGARDDREFRRQHSKLVAALDGLAADVIGLIEIENDDGASLEVMLNGQPGGPEGLNSSGGGDYAWVMAQGFGAGSDAIGLAFIYRTSVLRPVGATRADTSPLHNRPPVAQDFEHLESGEVFTLILAHLKSRGGCESNDPDRGSGCWDSLRARQMSSLMDTFSVSLDEGSTLVLGDMNAYALEAPVTALTDAGMTDLLATFVPVQERYTYVFSPGWSGYIDHALASPAILDQVCGAAVWHINSDEPPVFHYTGARFGPDVYSPDPFRSSDHDPVLVGLALGAPC